MHIASHHLSQADFINNYLSTSTPVFFNGPDTPVSPLGFDKIVDNLGQQRVPLYDSLFNLIKISTLEKYYNQYFNVNYKQESVPYLRWFTRQSTDKFPWSDTAFDLLVAEFWECPQWVPDSGYTFPEYQSPIDVGRSPFPAKGLFACPTGGMTSWHIDPWGSDAVLFQLIGKKRILIYPQDTAPPPDPEGLSSVLNFPSALPEGWQLDPLVDIVLSAGDAVFIPQNHPHSAVALTDSLSITWNFVHQSADLNFRSFRPSTQNDKRIIRYFTGPNAPTPSSLSK